jgi:hypothetical protein
MSESKEWTVVGTATFDNIDTSSAWVQVLGEIVYVFSHLEQYSFQVLEDYAPTEVQEVAVSMPFKQRTQVARALLVATLKNEHQELAGRWSTAFEEAIRSSEVRNRILHNPMLVEVSQHEGTGEFSASAAIHLLRTGGAERMDLGQVQSFLAQIKQLRLRLSELAFETLRARARGA